MIILGIRVVLLLGIAAMLIIVGVCFRAARSLGWFGLATCSVPRSLPTAILFPKHQKYN